MAHILVIDDDEQFRAMLVQMLTQDEHRVSLAADGDEGMASIRQVKPDLIVTDIIMPRKDGIEVIMELARQQSAIPIIAISGGRRSISADFNLESAALLGVRATLVKPFTRSDLRLAVEKALA